MDPQNPTPRGAYGADEEKDPLELIIKSFNERWFQGWEATPEDQRVKFISLNKIHTGTSRFSDKSSRKYR